jgi:restriction system protein
MTAWIIRAGRHGEREAWCLTNGAAGGGWNEVGDLSGCSSRDDVRAMLQAVNPTDKPGKLSNHAAQLWGLRNVVPGDLIVLPLKTTKTVAIGVCTKGYEYRPDAPLKHTVSVDWQRDDTPRTAFKEDLLYTLGAIMTIFKATRHSAEDRLRAVMDGSSDPGSLQATATGTAAPGGEAGDVDDPIVVPTQESIRDRVMTFLSENFKGHSLTQLVAEILEVRGFVCEVSPPGADQGVDILAGSGPLGLDSPTLIVEVKSEEGEIKAPVVRGLMGARQSHRADQALLVAWGGITKDARREIRTDRLSLRVWDADALLDQLFDVYEELPDATRANLPLKRAWVLDEEAG